MTSQKVGRVQRLLESRRNLRLGNLLTIVDRIHGRRDFVPVYGVLLRASTQLDARTFFESADSKKRDVNANENAEVLIYVPLEENDLPTRIQEIGRGSG